MKHAIRTTAIASLAVIGLTFAAGDKKAAAPPSPEQMQKNWEAAATPGEAHKKLEAYAGEWTAHAKMWMQPGADPVESDGTASTAWIMGGRYMEMNMKSTFMGQPMEGRALMGHNNMRQTYESIWIDNMGTGISFMKGKFSADGKTFTYEGKMDDPMTGEKDKLFRFTDTFASKDEIVSIAHDFSGGKEFKMMETVYKRKK
jgi:Protein of unknown function (DUF1579)